MSIPPRPDPPVVGKVTHNSIELSWTAKADNSPCKGDQRLRFFVQEEEIGARSKGFGNVYGGYANTYVFQGLEPRTQYRYRVRCMNENGYSAWSQTVMISTTKKPKTCDDLHRAVAKGDEKAMNEILNELSHAALNAPDKYGLSPLMIASQCNFLHIVKALIAANADVTYENSSGKDSLMMACYSGNLEIAKVLRENGANWDHRDRTGSTALHWAVDGGSVDTIRWMIQDGAAIDARDYVSGWTPLMRLAAIPSSPSTTLNIAKLLIHHNANIHTHDKDGKTILMVAAMNGLEALVKLLVSKGADVMAKNSYGKNALDMAKSFNREKLVEFLDEHVKKIKTEDQKKRLQAIRDSAFQNPNHDVTDELPEILTQNGDKKHVEFLNLNIKDRKDEKNIIGNTLVQHQKKVIQEGVQ